MKLIVAICLIGAAAAVERDTCPMTCDHSTGLITVDHDPSSNHKQHRCYVSDTDVCECECRESNSNSWIHQDLTAQHCVGSWSTTTTCSPACDSTCKDTETYSFTTQPNAIGNACPESNGATRDGTERTGMTTQNCVGSWATTTTCSPACDSTCKDTETFTITTPANSCGTCEADDQATRDGTERTGMTTQNCVGSWSTTTTCSPACDSTCYDTETFSITQAGNSCGTACSAADGDTRNGLQRTGDACPPSTPVYYGDADYGDSKSGDDYGDSKLAN